MNKTSLAIACLAFGVMCLLGLTQIQPDVMSPYLGDIADAVTSASTIEKGVAAFILTAIFFSGLIHL